MRILETSVQNSVPHPIQSKHYMVGAPEVRRPEIRIITILTGKRLLVVVVVVQALLYQHDYPLFHTQPGWAPPGHHTCARALPSAILPQAPDLPVPSGCLLPPP